MLHTLRSRRGMAVAPHHLAAQAGRDVLRDGGSAIEATVAIAATLAVVYPHMTGIGGDGFWLIREPDGRVHAIDACGRAAQAATLAAYAGQAGIPWRGPGAANTVNGTVSGWALALAHAKSGDPALIAGYVGKSEALDDALATFALAYADQTERDYALLVKAAKSGRIEVARGEAH